MNIYWMLIIWLCIVCIFSQSMQARISVSANLDNIVQDRTYSWLGAFLVCLPLLFFATFRGDDIGDTHTYKTGFAEIPTQLSQLHTYLQKNTKDVGFTVFVSLCKRLFGDNNTAIFFVIALISILGIICLYRSYSINFVFSVFLFVASTDYVSWMLNGIRQFLPVAILAMCTPLILNKKYIKLIIIILLLSSIHASALVFLPFIFICKGKPWNKKTLTFIAAVIIAIFFMARFTNLLDTLLVNSQYSEVVGYFSNDDGTNILRVLVYAVPMLLALIGKQTINEIDDPVVNLSVNMSIVTTGFYLISCFTSGIYVGRLPIYFSLFNYILLPWEIEHLFTTGSKKIVYILAIVFYLVFYWYQLDVTWQYI